MSQSCKIQFETEEIWSQGRISKVRREWSTKYFLFLSPCFLYHLINHTHQLISPKYRITYIMPSFYLIMSLKMLLLPAGLGSQFPRPFIIWPFLFIRPYLLFSAFVNVCQASFFTGTLKRFTQKCGDLRSLVLLYSCYSSVLSTFSLFLPMSYP